MTHSSPTPPYANHSRSPPRSDWSITPRKTIFHRHRLLPATYNTTTANIYIYMNIYKLFVILHTYDSRLRSSPFVFLFLFHLTRPVVRNNNDDYSERIIIIQYYCIHVHRICRIVCTVNTPNQSKLSKVLYSKSISISSNRLTVSVVIRPFTVFHKRSFRNWTRSRLNIKCI